MHETDAELDALDALLDRSFAAAGPAPDRHHLATAAAHARASWPRTSSASSTSWWRRRPRPCEPRCSAVDTLFLHGRVWFSTSATSAKARHLERRACGERGPRRSATTWASSSTARRGSCAARPTRRRRWRPHWRDVYGATPEDWVDAPHDARYVEVVPDLDVHLRLQPATASRRCSPRASARKPDRDARVAPRCARVRAMAPIELVLGRAGRRRRVRRRARPTGRVVFVRHGIEGERVLAELTEEHATWARADVTEVLEPSPDRVEPPCPYAGPGRCGGCDYQHVDARRPSVRSRRVGCATSSEPSRASSSTSRSPLWAPRTDGLGTRTRVRFAADAERPPLDAPASQPRPRPRRSAAPSAWRRSARSGSPRARSRPVPRSRPSRSAAPRRPRSPSTAATRSRDRARRTAAAHRGARGAGARRVPVDRPSAACVYDVSPGVFWQVHVDGPELLVRRGARRASPCARATASSTSTAARGSSPRRRRGRSARRATSSASTRRRRRPRTPRATSRRCPGRGSSAARVDARAVRDEAALVHPRGHGPAAPRRRPRRARRDQRSSRRCAGSSRCPATPPRSRATCASCSTPAGSSCRCARSTSSR